MFLIFTIIFFVSFLLHWSISIKILWKYYNFSINIIIQNIFYVNIYTQKNINNFEKIRLITRWYPCNFLTHSPTYTQKCQDIPDIIDLCVITKQYCNKEESYSCTIQDQFDRMLPWIVTYNSKAARHDKCRAALCFPCMNDQSVGKSTRNTSIVPSAAMASVVRYKPDNGERV